MDINELSLDKIGVWPSSVRITTLGIIFIVILILGYIGLIKPRLADLAVIQKQQEDLKSTYQIKYREAANLPAYEAQLTQMQVVLKGMLAQLTVPSEIPQLIEDISKLGTANGLELNLVKPDAEVARDFYAEMPIDISVTGDYHSIGLFISQVGTLQKIVTFNDFTIVPANNPANTAPGEPAKPLLSAKGSTVLVMNATARTYRYLDKPTTSSKAPAGGATPPPPTGGK